jgi:4'-phosphopantetheinyl transferase
MTAAPWSRVSRPQPLLRDTVWTTHRLRYPASMQPLTPSQVLDHTEGQMRSCEPGYCDLWLVSAKVDIPNREILESVLSTNEREHADRFRFEADCVRSIVARGGLRRILSSYCPASPHAMEFHTGSHGKPALLRPSAALEFNISHSGDCVLIAVTSGVPCGVDIEHGRPITAEREIAERLFCPRELEWLSRTQNGFRRLWALKEAIIKAMGLGLSIPLSQVDVTDVLESKTSSITLRTPGMEPQVLWLRELFLLPNYAAAVATVQDKRIFRLVPDQIEQSIPEDLGEPDGETTNRP